MPSDRDDPTEDRQRRSRRWDASLLVALASVLVALVFNALQAHGTARQLNQSQKNLAFTSLMNMYDRIARADLATTKAVVHGLAFDDQTLKEAAKDENSPAGRRVVRAQVAMVAAVTPLDGVVSALDNDVVAVAGARELWTNFLVCDYREVRDELVREGAGVAGFNMYLWHLARFNARHPGHRECITGGYD